MTVTITAALAGAGDPQAVQVVVTGLTPGLPVVVTGSAPGYQWQVRGGAVPAPGSQLVLGDLLAPLNASVTYTVTHDGQTAVSSPVVVVCDRDYVLQSLDGQTTIRFDWHGSEDPRDELLRLEVLEIAGRADPALRWDVSAGESGELQIRTSPDQTRALVDRLRSRGPLFLLRTDGRQYDIEPARFVALATAGRRLFGVDGARLWTLRYYGFGDPDPSVPLPVASWPDFNAYYDRTVTRTQWSRNPSFETNATLNQAGALSGCSVSRATTGGAPFGSAYLAVAATGGDLATVPVLPDAPLPWAHGRWVTFGLSMRSVSGPTHARLQIQGTAFSAAVSGPWVALTTSWQRVAVAAMIWNDTPAPGLPLVTTLQLAGSAAGGTPTAGTTRVDGWSIEEGLTEAHALARALAYVDGDSPGGTWNGTAHASRSTIVQPASWVDFNAEWAAASWPDLNTHDWVGPDA